jgi:hypothetical protein
LFSPDPLTNAAARAGARWTAADFTVAHRAAVDESMWLSHEM